MSVALLDPVCPPSTGFAVYNHLSLTEKEMRVYPYNGHEGGAAIHEEEKYRFVRKYFRQC
jgi:cephalosporin-C deacetylase